jgi:DNA-binding transcriptional MerR regulator/methylmalonyl-CoA mutase cobalamin-binding subunit
MAEDHKYSIKIVARKTGLSPHAIRIWEKRYAAVSPARTPTNRRLYSHADIQRLLLLQRATAAGHAIGQVAHLPNENLQKIIALAEPAPSPSPGATSARRHATSEESHLETCIAAIQKLSAEGLETALANAAVALSQPILIEQLLAPLMHKVGDMWREGTIRVTHEHMATAVVRSFLGNIRSAYEASATGPNLIVTTPVGQLHELGALMAAVTAASEGWRVTYLGPNLPSEEIAAAAQQNRSRVVALSIVYLADDSRLEAELRRLRRFLPDAVSLLFGGRAAAHYRETLESLQTQIIKDMASFSAILESLRWQPALQK